MRVTAELVKDVAEDVAYGVRSAVRTRSVTIGPVRIMPVKVYRSQLLVALEIGQEQGLPSDRQPSLAPVRHLRAVREAQG